YAQARERVARFEFNQAVVDVFPDMIKRSVPGYSTVLAMTGMFAARYIQAGSTCYDLGCSLGAATLSIGRAVEGIDCQVIGVDNAPAMITACQSRIDEAGLATPVTLRCKDISDVPLENASLVVLNYTLQFIHTDERQALLASIYEGLLPGGALVLSEKIVFGDAEKQALMTALHLDFKRANGYSELEISQKRTALEDVLVPDTEEVHLERLKQAGFPSPAMWFQSLNFVSILAVKPTEQAK
ncbi:MAG: carboxy-S-adenosyl-L-methionine synthase CmoA, partial [Rhodothermales bacterium]